MIRTKKMNKDGHDFMKKKERKEKKKKEIMKNSLRCKLLNN